jgi:hypothetical protein
MMDLKKKVNIWKLVVTVFFIFVTSYRLLSLLFPKIDNLVVTVFLTFAASSNVFLLIIFISIPLPIRDLYRKAMNQLSKRDFLFFWLDVSQSPWTQNLLISAKIDKDVKNHCETAAKEFNSEEKIISNPNYKKNQRILKIELWIILGFLLIALFVYFYVKAQPLRDILNSLGRIVIFSLLYIHYIFTANHILKFNTILNKLSQNKSILYEKIRDL